MSWDIFVQDIPDDVRSVNDIPNHFVPAPVGKRTELIKQIKEVAPFADFSDPAWGKIDGKGFSIEVNLGEDEEVDGFAFHVRGNDVAAGLISEILAHLNLSAFDSGTGDLFDHTNAAEGLKKWREYRNYIVEGK